MERVEVSGPRQLREAVVGGAGVAWNPRCAHMNEVNVEIVVIRVRDDWGSEKNELVIASYAILRTQCVMAGGMQGLGHYRTRTVRPPSPRSLFSNPLRPWPNPGAFTSS
jgi:hypothetical protein